MGTSFSRGPAWNSRGVRGSVWNPRSESEPGLHAGLTNGSSVFANSGGCRLDESQSSRSREREHALLETGTSLGMERVGARGGDFLAEQRPGQTEVQRQLFDLPRTAVLVKPCTGCSRPSPTGLRLGYLTASPSTLPVFQFDRV
jgi:hypothetical protein